MAESLEPLLAPYLKLRLVSRRRNRLLRFFNMMWSVFRYGRGEQPVVIDTFSTLNFYFALCAGILCRFLGIRYYCVLHGGNLPARLNRNPRLCKMLFSASLKNIAPSAYLQEAFGKAGYPTLLIPNFIPIENYPFQLRRQLRPRILWVRAFDSTYNPLMAVQVLQQITAVYPNVQLCMVGPDKDGSRSVCENLVDELGLANRVHLTGRISKEKWIALSADYDIFINTTNFDNTPVSVIEAMALGLPIISTNVGGIPYLIDDGVDGILVDKGDVVSMVAAIYRLLNDPDQAAHLSKNARSKAESFDSEVVLEQWKNLLNN